MATIAENLQSIADSKAAIKAAIEGKGVEVGNAPLADYAGKISEIEGGGCAPDILEVQSTTVYPADTKKATAMASNPGIKIYDRSGKEWTLGEWDEAARACNYDLEARERPIGISIRAGGEKFVLLMEQWDADKYYDVTGTYRATKTATSGIYEYAQMLRHGQYNFTSLAGNNIDELRKGVFGDNYENVQHGVTGKYHSARFVRTKLENGDYDIYIENTKTHFTLPADGFVGTAATVNTMQIIDKIGAHCDMQLVYSEICRHMFAVCSGLTTTEEDGTIAPVDIVTSGGEMYFAVGGVQSQLLAKYNINNGPNNSNIYYTQAMADAVYSLQKSSGTNMNSEKVLTPGAKGAEAIAVDGYWYIITPYLTNGNAATTNRTGTSNEVPDNVIMYWMRYMREHNDYNVANTIVVPSERWLQMAYFNKTIITSILDYLKREGWQQHETVLANIRWKNGCFNNQSCWSGVRYSTGTAWYVGLVNGVVSNSGTSTRYYAPLASAL